MEYYIHYEGKLGHLYSYDIEGRGDVNGWLTEWNLNSDSDRYNGLFKINILHEYIANGYLKKISSDYFNFLLTYKD